MKILSFLLLFIFASVDTLLLAQGCSDAGVCTAGNLNHPGIDSGNYRSALGLNVIYGMGEKGVHVFSPQIEYVQKFGKRSQIQLKLPYVIASGNLGVNAGPGDIIVVYSHELARKKNIKMGINAGSRIGINASDAGELKSTSGDRLALPMPYQTGLGTTDFLMGIDFIYKKWFFALATQIPLLHYNENNFDTGKVETAEASAYFSSDSLIRKPDIVFRFEKFWPFKSGNELSAGLLFIVHPVNDISRNTGGMTMPVLNSDGLTLNFNLSYKYHITDRMEITGRFATPLLVREVRPDGLTRSVVLSILVNYKF